MRASQTVLRSQRVYRTLLRATANPGELVVLPHTGPGVPQALLTALLDHEATFAVVGEGAREAGEELSWDTGASVVPVPKADFALALDGGFGGTLTELKRGTLEDPAEGATAIYAVRRLSERGPLTLCLAGPGVPGERTVGIGGLAEGEIEMILETRAGYPLGVDVYFVDREGVVVGLPRSTRVWEVS